jgi:hypothetical protein
MAEMTAVRNNARLVSRDAEMQALDPKRVIW